MHSSETPTLNQPFRWLKFTFFALLFALAYTQSPLYTSNQNQYFLHGLARAGYGLLESDWLANTLDPTPVFSLLVQWTYQLTRAGFLFYVYYALLMGVYLFALLGIVTSIYPIRKSPTTALLFIALLIIVHSAATRFALSRTLGVNWTYVLEDGVADQRLLGPVLQPSTFGVFLVLSIYLYLHDKPYLAILSAVLAATFHPVYLLSAAVLTASYMLGQFLKQKSQRAALFSISIGACALVFVAPILIYVFNSFGHSPLETTARARDILINVRIPHHVLVSWWFDATAIVKILFILGALFLIRKHALFPVLLFTFGASLVLTLIQITTGNTTLALIFPWRLSVFLVPISMAILLGRLVIWLAEKPLWEIPGQTSWLRTGSLIAITLAALVGIVRMTIEFSNKTSNPERPLMNYVAAHLEPGNLYLTPEKMQDFRLATGAPVFIEFKSIPYQDADVLEWYRRLKRIEKVYKTNQCQLLDQLATEEGVTHAVFAMDQPAAWCPQLQIQYQDAFFGLYKLRANP